MSDNPTVLCEVTGQQVPADETVILDGKRVGAEGKAILLERMKSGESGESQLHPGFGKRFGALLLDGLIIGIPTKIAEQLAGVSMGAASQHDAGAMRTNALAQLVIGFVFGLGGLAYIVLMHAARGQTLGKMACGIKVVNDTDLSPISFGLALKRGLWHQGPGLLTAVIAIPLTFMLWPATGANSSSLLAYGAIVGGLGVLAFLYILISAIMAAADSGKQLAIHDRIAKTRVVRVTGLNNLSAPLPQAQA